MATGAAVAPPYGAADGVAMVEQQQAAGVGILLQISMLVRAFVLGHLLRRRRVYYLPEASASLLIGLIVGGLANVSNTQKSTRRWFNFREELFFLFLLPPIIFQSGFSLAPKPFFSNFGAIITFAIVGTFIASIVTGLLVYLAGLIYLVYRLPLVECMMFGALVSATDPVTVLSIFQELGTDVNLYVLVFGESVLNDAVWFLFTQDSLFLLLLLILTPCLISTCCVAMKMAISLYRTMASLRTNASGQNFFIVILRFLETFFGSMSTGVGVGFISALISFTLPSALLIPMINMKMCSVHNRLARRLHEIVASNQSAFIKGRCIQDNFMLVQQTAKFLNQQKAPRILLKLDISKAFDSNSWPFLLEVLRHRGFGPIWRNLICGLLNASSTRVLLNGIPGEETQHQRGLRQGDPLSPMLFILVMDVLNATIQKASDEGLLQPLANRPLKHRVSLYADDVVLFLRPVASDLELISAVLQLFGTASGLKTNIQKSSASPIQCSDEDIAIIQQHMSCVVQDFPCKYLGLPLSFKKLTKGQVQPIIDRIAAHLPGWKSDLMNRAGRLVMVQFVMTSMVIYLAIASDLPPWAIKEIDKIRRSFLWRGRREANGGHCLLTWPRVSRPKELGGLGIHDLKSLGWALRLRWLWLAKTQPDRPWAEFKILLHPSVHAFFSMAVFTVVGDGKSTLFWTDKWLHGQSIELLAPHLFALVYKRTAKRRTIFDALLDNYWIRDLRGALTMATLFDYFVVWNLVSDVQLQPDLADVHNWRLTASGQYSAKSAYNALFFGSVQFDPWKLIWNTWAPKKCQFFLWLAFHNRCWTADRLAKRGLPHPAQCPLCDQEDETIQHILCGCVVARQIWSLVFRRYGLPDFSPLPDDKVLHVWWMRILDLFPDNCKRGLNSLIILVAWSLWKHRNDIVFNGAALNVQRILKRICEEANLWCLASASGLAHLAVTAR